MTAPPSSYDRIRRVLADARAMGPPPFDTLLVRRVVSCRSRCCATDAVVAGVRSEHEPAAFPQLAAAPAAAHDRSFGQLRRGRGLRRDGLITCLSCQRGCTEQARYQQDDEKCWHADHETASLDAFLYASSCSATRRSISAERAQGARRTTPRVRAWPGACYVSTPTMAPIRQVAIVPDTIDLRPSESTSSRRSGAMVPSPAIMMPSEPKLAKPHMA